MRFENKAWAGAQFEPRRWQSEALPLALESAKQGRRHVVQAIMGAGKSLLLAELAACAEPDGAEKVVITTSSVDLVDQLHRTVGLRCGMDKVGRYYTHAKESAKQIIICCDDSAVQLARRLKTRGYGVGLLICDEAHKTECDTFVQAMDVMEPGAAVGFTATPFRDSSKDSLSLFEKCQGRHSPLLYRYGPREGLRDGVVVPWQIVPWTGKQVELDDACLQIVKGAKGPGVVSASSVADAEEFVERLRAAGIPSDSLHYKSGRDRKRELLSELESGKVKCIVAVNMLTEGVDLPWLRWLCLRRQMSSRVAFAQFVGRALRACEGKTHAVLYDPWNLFDTHRISHSAALQGGVEEPQDEVTEAVGPAQKLSKETKVRYAKALKRGPAFLVRVTVALSACGVLPAQKVWSGRSKPASRNQIQAIERSARLLVGLPEIVLDGLRDIYRIRHALSIGQASDFLNIIYKLPRAGWPDEATQLIGGSDVD